MKIFKKSAFTLPLAFALLHGMLTAFADDAAEKAATVLSQVEIINYIVYAGIAIFILGLIFVLISFYIKTKHKDELDEEPYDIPENEEPIEDEDEDDIEESEKSEADEEVPEEAAEETPEEASEEASEEAPEEAAEEVPEEVPEEAAEETPEETSEKPPEEKAEEKTEEQNKEEASQQAIKITLSGINSMDLKMTELQTSITIGRKPANDIFISDNSVSGKHCLISRTDDDVFIEDLDSTNGTIVNGKMISEKTPLSSGDTLTLGKQAYKVHISK